MDLFTSNNINGVGKSSVLEAIKLALLGEIPGKAKTLDDLLQFTSSAEMSVRIIVESGAREVTAERRFLRDAGRGERRPITINQSVHKYEEGDQWIRNTLGAVSLGFDPYEFLNLSDQKKRQWIISHSPESSDLSRDVLYVLLFARMVEGAFGAGLVREQALALGMDRVDVLLDPAFHADKVASRLLCNLTEIIERQDKAWVQRIRSMLDKVFETWVEGRPTSVENITSMFMYLKAEILRLKNFLHEQTTAASCLAVVNEEFCSTNIEHCRELIHQLDQEIENFNHEIEQIRSYKTEQINLQKRRHFLQENIDNMTRKLLEDSREALEKKVRKLEERLVDTHSLEAELDQLGAELRKRSENYHRHETRFLMVSEELKLRRDKLQSLKSHFHVEAQVSPVCVGLEEEGFHTSESCVFQCPIAPEIRCETDMQPYSALFVRELKTMEQKESVARTILEKSQKDLQACSGRIGALQDQVKRQAQANEVRRREIINLQRKLAEEEKERAKSQGKLIAYREEMQCLDDKAATAPFCRSGVVENIEVLESKKRECLAVKKKEEETLAALLREQGRAEAVAELIRKKKELELELKDGQMLAGYLGPNGIQGEIATRVADALELEVNTALKLIDESFDFTIDLSGARFLMGWNRDSKMIPFMTINSAHFILFIVPFLAVLLKRMSRNREREGLPTLKVLCVEAESMTPNNLVALLRGLSVMKAKGYLDNVLVAHYASIRDPEKLFGFKEHILEEGGESLCEEL